MIISKSIKIAFCLILVLCSLSVVSANGNNTLDIQEIDDGICPVNETVILTEDYVCSCDELNVTRNITVEGNNHSILANDSESILTINVSDSCSLVLKNINFYVPIQLISNSSDITLIDCNLNVSTQNYMKLYLEGSSFGKAGKISNNILNRAKTIVGKYKDLRAIRKLAVWVGRNIVHDTREGFYQSPEITLNSKKGNCCSQALLFLQMCESLGLLKNHKAYFVHVGLEIFGKRHFFAIIDNICIDVDSCPNNPWGHASLLRGDVFVTTNYPTLPLEINY